MLEQYQVTDVLSRTDSAMIPAENWGSASELHVWAVPAAGFPTKAGKRSFLNGQCR